MRALVLGGRGAVGAAATAALRDRGHSVVVAGRRPSDDGGVVIDASTPEGRARLASEAEQVDVVLDASGLELPAVQGAVGGTPLVDVSATAVHLERLAAGVGRSGTVLLGAGIAPGVSTVLVHALRPVAGDEIDVGVLLGAGEAHGRAAVEWTARLAGAPVHAAPEARPVVNLRSTRRLPRVHGADRVFLRADFPDDLLAGRPLGVVVRSWLAMDSRVATVALRVVGALPTLAPLLARAPHLGSDAWSVSAIHRRTGRMLVASGNGQSVATGRVAALAAERLVERRLQGAVTMADVLHPNELEPVDGLSLHERAVTAIL